MKIVPILLMGLVLYAHAEFRISDIQAGIFKENLEEVADET